MKQVEITTRVRNTIKEVDEILSKQGFKIIRKFQMEDNYKTFYVNDLNKNNVLDILSKCVIIRYLKMSNGKVVKVLTYKNKKYDKSTVLYEEKIEVNIDNINNADKLLDALGFKTILKINNNSVVYSNNKIELCFQNIEGLGLLLEYENSKDFTGFSNEDILKEKQKMLEEIKKYNLDITNEIDVKKAFELIKENFKDG